MTEENWGLSGESDGEDPIPEPIPEELLGYLRDALGGNVRAVAHYDHDSADIRTADGVGDGVTDEHVEEIIDDLRLQDVSQTRQESLFQVGSLYCTIRAFDDALVVHFIQGDARGTMISLEPSTAPGLTDFIYDVLGILHEHSEQEINRAPHWTRAEQD
ncbi:hypothetical protein [Halolamina sp. C58]|uniref:hypothetical protein n=1 Tax=Halolamina sp. C58 TaxID=3421640 RepID=UPI003EC10C95